MKIVSWNIQQGGGTRADSIVQSLLAHKADFIILSEFRNNPSGQLIRIRLLMDGFIFQSPSTEDKETNGVLIASRQKCNFELFSTATDFPEAILKCVHSDFAIYGVYLPHKKKHTRFEAIQTELINHPTIHTIIAGDFNSGFNKIDQVSDSFWYEDRLRGLQKLGMLDAYRHFFPVEKEYSWISHQGNGYRYDHTWVSAKLLPNVLKCSYSHVERDTKLSDHSLMILELA